MRIAHVREVHGPVGGPWRLAAAPRAGGPQGVPAPVPDRWIDLELVRRRLVAHDPGRAHNAM
ncbi:MAG TPA: hypothetical protein VGQ85_04810, partial [Candidatus Limnocylindrales bacterium]|nr:hypothetical protein [Candidatus Limnocylindrales bacterium]